MTRATYDFIGEPTGEILRALLRHCATRCQFFSLIYPPEVHPSDGLHATETALRPFVVNEARATSWPGTLLLSGHAIRRDYALDPASLDTLVKQSSGLYDWVGPEKPEDLTLWRDRTDPMLVTISHERDGYLCLTDDEYARLADVVAALPCLVRAAS